MARERRTAVAAALVLALVVTLEFLPALSLGFVGDDFELLSLARIGGFAPRALFLPHRGAFVKPVLNAAWAAGGAVFGANPGAWYTVALLVHLLDATLLGFLACRLVDAWGGTGPADAGNASRPAAPGSPMAAPAGAGPMTGTRAGMAGRSGFIRGPAPTGLLAAFIWAVHDRLSEPVFSIASLNHSLTLAFYLAAMLAAVSALAERTPRSRLLTAFFVLLTLFSYEVGASLLLALGLLVLFAPGGTAGLRSRLASLGIPTAAAVIVWAVVQAASRLAPGAVSYYALSPSLWMDNLAEIGLSFLHIPSHWIEPSGAWALPFAALLLAAALWPRLDRVTRFGCAWSLAACLPVLPIPFFSDRYHYIVFAGAAVALGRAAALAIGRAAAPTFGCAGDPVPQRARVLGGVAVASPLALPVVALLVAHLVWSILGSREQAAFYAFKGLLPARLLEEARASDEALAEQPAPVVALAWRGDPDLLVRAYREEAARFLKPRFSEAHPFYFRTQGVLGAAYPADLFNAAACGSMRFYRRPEPVRTAKAIASGHLRVVPLGLFTLGRTAGPGLPERLAARLREEAVARREIPMALSAEEGAPAPAWSVAWLEPTDRAGAFEAEYGPVATLVW